MTRITKDELEKFRLHFSTCANRDVIQYILKVRVLPTAVSTTQNQRKAEIWGNCRKKTLNVCHKVIITLATLKTLTSKLLNLVSCP